MQAPQFERRVRTRALIEKMLDERRQVLVLLLRVSGVEPYGSGQPATETLHAFRQLLTDYIASAHFGLYERIADGTERRQPVLQVALRTYERIAQTTETAMAFADAYDDLTGDGALPSPGDLHGELSTLGEALATRIELEDELIVAMLGEKPAPVTRRAEVRPAGGALSRG